MKTKITAGTFNFDYTGDRYKNEKELTEKGIIPLISTEIIELIGNKTIWGDYLYGYKYVVDINEDGTAEGVNNVGSHNIGKWFIDEDKFTIMWNNGWDYTTTRVYKVGGNLEFFDVSTGKWRTTFKKFKNW